MVNHTTRIILLPFFFCYPINWLYFYWMHKIIHFVWPNGQRYQLLGRSRSFSQRYGEIEQPFQIFIFYHLNVANSLTLFERLKLNLARVTDCNWLFICGRNTQKKEVCLSILRINSNECVETNDSKNCSIVLCFFCSAFRTFHTIKPKKKNKTEEKKEHYYQRTIKIQPDTMGSSLQLINIASLKKKLKLLNVKWS